MFCIPRAPRPGQGGAIPVAIIIIRGWLTHNSTQGSVRLRGHFEKKINQTCFQKFLLKENSAFA
jgi:hypothetical protein